MTPEEKLKTKSGLNQTKLEKLRQNECLSLACRSSVVLSNLLFVLEHLLQVHCLLNEEHRLG